MCYTQCFFQICTCVHVESFLSSSLAVQLISRAPLSSGANSPVWCVPCLDEGTGLVGKLDPHDEKAVELVSGGWCRVCVCVRVCVRAAIFSLCVHA